MDHVEFDRLTAVILWNAGCAGCLPEVREVAQLGAAQGFPVYGVAVMVRDVDRTAEAALQAKSPAILALEKRQADLEGLMRGSVTRNWLEASGQQGVPSAFLVDKDARIVWIGHPADIADVLPAIVDGSWDVIAARDKYRSAMSGTDIANLRIVRDVTDALVTGQIDEALDLITIGERHLPSLASDVEFAILKFSVLAAHPKEGTAAIDYYREVAAGFPGDLPAQSMLAGTAIRQLRAWPDALRIALDAMTKVSDGPAANTHEAAHRIYCRLLEAEAAAGLGYTERASSLLDRVTASTLWANLPATEQAWANAELERVRDLIL